MIDFFTKQEKTIILFLVSGLLIGAGIRIYNSKKEFKPNTDEELAQIELQITERAQAIDSLLSRSDTNISKEILTTQLININNASQEELVKLPNVGPILAGRILEYRKQNGKFKNIKEIKKVKGIGEKKFIKITPYIKI